MELVVAMTYAKAIFDAAKELDKISTIQEEINQIDEILKKDKEYLSLLENPAISDTDKKSLVKNVFEGRVCDEVLNTLCILIDKKRMAYYDKIVSEYNKLVDEYKQLGEGVVYSCVKLSDEQMRHLEEDAGKLLHEKVELTNEIDESLIGGIKLMVDEKLIDASFKTRLKTMKTKVKEI